MTFLNPAVLFGLIASAIPVVLHFLNLRKLKKIEFSTLSFLKELQKTKIKRIKLKQLLLLVLRISIIIFLVTAFARPTLKNISFDNSLHAKTSAVIIIDNSFSMSVLGVTGSYLNQSKQLAKNLIDNFHAGDEITILTQDNLSSTLQKPSTDFRQIQKQINETQISYVSGTINEFMAAAAQILFQSKNYNKEIYLFSDLQKDRIFNSQSEISDLSNILGHNINFYMMDVSEKEPTNLGIVELKPKNQIFEKGKTISFDVLIKNYSNHAVNNSVVSFFVNGKRNSQQSLILQNNESKDLTFETTLLDTGLVEISAELEDDDIIYDNKRFFSFYVPSSISMLLLYDKPEDAGFVKLVTSHQFQQNIKVTEDYVSRMPSLQLNKFDFVFVAGSENNSDWKNLFDYVSGGGSVIIVPGSENTLVSFQHLCSALKIPKPEIVVGKKNSREIISQFGKIDFQSPLFLDLFESKTNPQLESPEIYYYFKTVPGAESRNIISMFDGSSFLSEYKISNGKVLLFNSSLNLSWNNFPLKGFFAPLVNKLIFYASSKIKEQNELVAGKSAVINISGRTLKQIKIEKPNGITELVNSEALVNQNYLIYLQSDLTGTYKFYSADKLLDYISVNHDPHESVAEKFNSSEFEDYLKRTGFTGSFYLLTPNENFIQLINQSRYGFELWKYFLITALTLAILESFVASSSKKELSTFQNQASSIKHQGFND